MPFAAHQQLLLDRVNILITLLTTLAYDDTELTLELVFSLDLVLKELVDPYPDAILVACADA